MPVLGLPKEWLHPHLSLTHRLLVRLGVPIAPHPLAVLFIEMPPQRAALRARGAALPHRTGPTRARRSLIGPHLPLVVRSPGLEQRALWTDIDIPLGVVREFPVLEEWAGLLPVHHRHIGTDPQLLENAEVLPGAIGGIGNRPL